jgi:hypothetical protein
MVLTRKNALGVVVVVALVAAVITALLVAWNRPNGSAEAADALPTSATPQVSISDNDKATLAKLRKQAESEPHKIDADLNQRILTGKLDGLIRGPLSDSQRAILTDGIITFDEYRTAETAWHTCMADAGLSVPPLHLNGLARYNQSIISGPDREQLDRADWQCKVKYTGAIDLVWAGVTLPLTQEVAQVQAMARTSCLTAAGFSVAEANTEGNYAAEDADGKCIEAIEKATDTRDLIGG